MKICKKCKIEFKDDYEFCPKCGRHYTEKDRKTEEQKEEKSNEKTIAPGMVQIHATVIESQESKMKTVHVTPIEMPESEPVKVHATIIETPKTEPQKIQVKVTDAENPRPNQVEVKVSKVNEKKDSENKAWKIIKLLVNIFLYVIGVFIILLFAFDFKEKPTRSIFSILFGLSMFHVFYKLIGKKLNIKKELILVARFLIPMIMFWVWLFSF